MEKTGYDRFMRARVDAQLALLAETDCKATAEELDAAAKKAEGKAIMRVGDQSEKKFVDFASKSLIVKSVVNANPLNDAYDAIDKWVVLVDGFNMPPLPVQIKSSFRGVEVFKYGDPSQEKRPNQSFTKLHGLMMVINCGPSSTMNLFDNQLRKEVGRMVQVLKSDPLSQELLTKITPNRLLL